MGPLKILRSRQVSRLNGSLLSDSRNTSIFQKNVCSIANVRKEFMKHPSFLVLFSIRISSFIFLIKGYVTLCEAKSLKFTLRSIKANLPVIILQMGQCLSVFCYTHILDNVIFRCCNNFNRCSHDYEAFFVSLFVSNLRHCF